MHISRPRLNAEKKRNPNVRCGTRNGEDPNQREYQPGNSGVFYRDVWVAKNRSSVLKNAVEAVEKYDQLLDIMGLIDKMNVEEDLTTVVSELSEVDSSSVCLLSEEEDDTEDDSEEEYDVTERKRSGNEKLPIRESSKRIKIAKYPSLNENIIAVNVENE